MSSPEPGLIHRRHAALCLAATSRLSPYLAHGCLSARRLYAEVRAFEQRRRRNRSTYWVYHELVMRGAPPSEFGGMAGPGHALLASQPLYQVRHTSPTSPLYLP